jgi:hypothetical protein
MSHPEFATQQVCVPAWGLARAINYRINAWFAEKALI